MGFEILDLHFQIERQLGVALRWEDYPAEAYRVPGFVTAGLVSDLVQAKLKAHRHAEGKPVQSDIWPQMQRIIAEVVAMNPADVRRESRLVDDLGYG